MTHVPKKVVRTRGIKSCQLWDHSGYVLGKDIEDPERAKRLHKHFVGRCQLIADETKDSGAEAVAKFISNFQEQNISQHPLCEELFKAEAISFRLKSDDVLVFERPSVHQWLSDNPLSSKTETGQCLVCGEWGNIERILPTIKGIRGCNPIGVRLTAINNIRTGNSCLGAYGLTQGYCAPTCEQCSYKYGNALNHLLRPDSQNKIHIGRFTLVFWCPQGQQLEILIRKAILGGKDTQQVKDKNGKILLKPNPTGFHWVPEPSSNVVQHLQQQCRNGYVNVVVFRGKDRRAAIEFYQRIPQTELVHNLCHWLSCTAVSDRELTPLRVFLAFLSQNKDLEHLRSSVLLSLLRAMFSKKPVSFSIIKQLTDYTGRRIKLSLLHEKLISYMSSLLPEGYKSSKAFLCGELIALLVKCQEEANGEATTIRCDTATVTSPARRLASYLKKNRHHLNLIGKQSFGRRVNLEKKIQRAVSEIGVFPELLDPDEQLILLSGYYCQRQALFPIRKEKKQC
ncbi:hypothetical protein GZ77_24685 [Endozoicomonas montiporae]|uniref:CRISPR-associated protein Csd1 n=2 Tax=Endozoicomonas montiporae TaxID=1027273 RepID=A0A081MZT6_9GAMM|nr:hypothetical protein GZ77_24685 [Endozoicomonas montiporae]